MTNCGFWLVLDYPAADHPILSATKTVQARALTKSTDFKLCVNHLHKDELPSINL